MHKRRWLILQAHQKDFQDVVEVVLRHISAHLQFLKESNVPDEYKAFPYQFMAETVLQMFLQKIHELRHVHRYYLPMEECKALAMELSEATSELVQKKVQDSGEYRIIPYGRQPSAND